MLKCEGNALELAIDQDAVTFNEEKATRFLLSRGDTFHLPPMNTYCLTNHSDKIQAEIYWTIMKVGKQVRWGVVVVHV